MPETDKQTRLLVSVHEACSALGIGRTTFYRLVREERVRLVRIGARSLVPISELERLATPEG
jgi:excisionase family DNA binding protein